MKRTTATGAVAGAFVDRIGGVQPGTMASADDANNWQEELCHPIELLGVSLDGTDQYQLEKAIIGLSKPVGEVYDMAIDEDAVAWASARNNGSPSGLRYNPIVKLWDGDHVLDTANYPLLVPKLRAQKAFARATLGGTRVSDFTVSVSGSTITGSGADWDNLLYALGEELLRAGSAQRYVNIGGGDNDYLVTATTPASHTMTVTGSPATGTQTAIVYPHRNGNATQARVFKDQGRAKMTPDGVTYINGLGRRDHLENHYHDLYGGGNGTAQGTINAASDTAGTGVANMSYTDFVRNPKTDGVYTPRTGPYTEPHSSIVFRVMHAGVYLA